MTSSKIKGLAALTITTSLMAMTAPAYAQLDEIVVTATKKEESLQDVSASIIAFDAEALENNRIEGLEDIAQYTPGLYSYPAAANSNGLRLSLRGIGTFDPQLGLDNKVAIYTDGVYLGKVVGLAFDSPDLARVEVLKGPQGTLYGRNAVAGAINLVSAAPDPSEFSGQVSVDYGNYNALGVTAGFNMPMGDTAAFRASGKFSARDGWVKNLGEGNDWAGYDRIGGRMAFLIEFSDKFDMTMAADYNKSTNEPYFYQAFNIGCGLDNEPAVGCRPGSSAVFGAAVQGATDDRIDEFTANGVVGDGFAENKGVSITTNWNFHENHSMRTTLAWRGLDSERYVQLNPQVNPAIVNVILNSNTVPNAQFFGQNYSFNNVFARLPELLARVGVQARADWDDFIPRDPVTGFYQSPDGERSPTVDGHSQISFETTSTGSFSDGKIDYTAGVYYFDESTATGRAGFNGGDAQDYLDLLAPGLGVGLPGLLCADAAAGRIPLAFCQVQGNPAPNAFVAGLAADGSANFLAGVLPEVRFATGNFLSVDTKAYAAYGQLTYHVNDDLRLIGGLRYSDETKKGFQQNLSPFFRDTIDLLGNPILPQSDKVSFDSLDPQAIIEYDVNDDLMVYASYSQAFRSGGFNASASLLPAAGETVGADFIFQPEEITSYEFGFKGDFGDRFRLNAAAFIYDIPNEQVTVSIDPLISTKRAIVNSKTDIWGIEADATFAMTEDFTLSGNIAYINGETDDLVSPNPQVGVVTRESIQGTPELSYSVAANYDRTLSNGMGVFGTINYSYKDEVETTPFAYLTEQKLLSGRIGLSKELDSGNEISLALWGQNLTDDEYTIDTLPFGPLSSVVNVFGTPRTYGMTAAMKF